jgi:hypothetical protein
VAKTKLFSVRVYFVIFFVGSGCQEQRTASMRYMQDPAA